LKIKPFIWIVLLLFCELNSLFAQEFFTQNYDEGKIDISVNEKKVIFYNLIGTNTDLQKFKINVVLPEGFRLLTNTSNFDSLKIGELKRLFFTISTDANTPFGEYSAEIQLKAADKIIGNYHLIISLQKYRNIEIQPIEKPDKLNQKAQEEIKFLVKNTGNGPEQITLTSRSGKVVGNSKISLLAGESIIVKTINDLPFSNQSIRLQSFDLSCTLPEIEKPFTSIFTVQMMSFQTAQNDPYQRFPIQASLVYNKFVSSKESEGAFFFDISGKGFIDAKDKHLVEFIARGPNQFDIPRFGSINQYFLGYKAGKWKVDLGDKMFIISNLTESSRFAKGAQVKRSLGGTGEVSVFYLKPRFLKAIQDEYGATYSHKFSENLKSEVVFLHKNHSDNGVNKQTDFLSFVSELVKSKYKANAEVSMSLTHNKLSMGAFYSSNLELEKFRMYTNIIFSGKNYFGFYNNSLQFSNSAFYNFNKIIGVGVSKNISQLNPSLDSFYYTVSPFINNNNLSLNIDINKRNKARFYLIMGQREDKMTAQSYHYKEQLFRYFYEYNALHLNFRFDGDLGRSLNLLEPKETQKYNDVTRVRGMVGYKSNRDFSTYVFLEKLNTTRYSSVTNNEKFWFYGVNTQLRIKNTLSFNLSYRNNFMPDELYQSQSFFDASVNLQVKKHELSLVSSYGYIPAPINDKNLFLTLKYTVNINTPIRKKKGLGRVMGQLNGVKTEGVVLNMNGRSVMTDKEGRFYFNDLVPGKYYLGANKSSLGFGNILDANMPYLVEIKPDEKKDLKLEIITTGKITGEIVAFNSQLEIFENIVVELYNDSFSKITTTNKQGGFQFSELKEGDYKVRVLSENIKKQYLIRNTNADLKVVKGGETLFTFEMEEKKRKVNFQKERIILSDL
jgi:hypothetical protein